ncbi:hypothetical protein QBC33DRAFT_577100 [Phialemonium atrogriseum]|uniref:Ketoreductase (KR) domain-containing protein n=1 Tax=Phialemonium atrogriseum TaxID=1093897 RepID=A0AAJ0C5Y0_9PEZI|nr:uncharacterized protein QBC33DRAFT_577100 [Phialemonium atrogriseum]KAK1769309.1 hypothetical protein QBC33DRAFT_577100 [Phialemonium atrogriseum]
MTSPRFNKWTAGTEVARALEDQIRGKQVLITGASPQSLGEAAALAIATAKPAVLILASRTPSKLNAVARHVREVIEGCSSPASTASADGTSSTIVETVQLDLASQASLLLPQLLEAASNGPAGSTRVVNVSSSAHRISPLRFGDYNFEGKPLPQNEKPRAGFPGTVAYAMSKCANVLFTVALKERLRERGIDSFAVDPGVIRTGLTKEIGPGLRKQLESLPQDGWQSPDQGCAVLLVAAFDPSLSGSEAIYLQDSQISRPASHASDKVKAQRL